MTDTAPARTVPNLRLDAQHPDGRLVRAVLASPRLMAAIPAGPLDKLVTAHDAATKAASAARRLPVEDNDFAAEIDAAYRAGRAVDPADLLARMGAAQAATGERKAALRLLGSFPERYEAAMIREIASHLPAYYAALGSDLGDLFDRAEPLVAKLGGINTADEAWDAGLSPEWAEVRALTREYSALRATHLALFQAEEQANYANGAPLPGKEMWGFAMFANVDQCVDDYVRIVRGTVTGMDGRPVAVPLPWPVLDPSSLEHFLRAVRDRAALQPHVGTMDEALDASNRVVIRDDAVTATPLERMDPELARYMMAQAKTAGYAQDVAERAEVGAWGPRNAEEYAEIKAGLAAN
jgi:hypothetical protein